MSLISHFRKQGTRHLKRNRRIIISNKKISPFIIKNININEEFYIQLKARIKQIELAILQPQIKVI